MSFLECFKNFGSFETKIKTIVFVQEYLKVSKAIFFLFVHLWYIKLDIVPISQFHTQIFIPMCAFDTSDIVPICRTLSNANDKFHCREDIPRHILETRGASKSSRNIEISFCIVSTSEKVAWCPQGKETHRQHKTAVRYNSHCFTFPVTQFRFCQIQQSLFYFSSYTTQICQIQQSLFYFSSYKIHILSDRACSYCLWN